MWFGLFECEEDQETADALLRTVREWGMEKGMDTLRGPASFDSNGIFGLLVDGFDSGPMVMMAYNPKYYTGLLVGAGLKKKKDEIEAFLAQVTQVTIDMCKHYESLGVDFICVREMGSGTDLLSPRMWKTLIQPNLTKVFDAISIPSVNHICGSTDMIIEMMNECGADALSVDQKNNVVETRAKVGNDVLIFGNFDPYGTLTTLEDTSAVADVIKK